MKTLYVKHIIYCMGLHVSTLYTVIFTPNFGIKSVNAAYMLVSQLFLTNSRKIKYLRIELHKIQIVGFLTCTQYSLSCFQKKA